MHTPIISLIAAASTNNVIGKNNQLVWDLPNDTQYFKNTVIGLPVIMGRKSYEGMGHALPGSPNIVLTTQPDWQVDDAQIATTLPQAIAMAAAYNNHEIFVTGGGQIYKEALSVADKIYITRVHGIFEGDAYFPVFDIAVWQLISQKNCFKDEHHAYDYSFEVWENIVSI